MYKMLYGDRFLFDPFDDERIVGDAKLTNNINAASYLDFTIYPGHPLYDVIEERSETVRLWWDNEELFKGQIYKIDIGMEGLKSVSCNSALEHLKDVQLRPYSTDAVECEEYEYPLDKAPDTLAGYFQWVIDQYNELNLTDTRFSVHVNQADYLTDRTVYFSSTSAQTVADAIDQNILGSYGGYLSLRYKDDELMLDLYSDIHEMNPQIIDFGENILDITKAEDTTDQYTAIYPTGYTPQYTKEQQKYHDEKAIYDQTMEDRDNAQRAKIDKLKREEDAEQRRIDGMPKGEAKTNAQNALKRRKEQREAQEKSFQQETERLRDQQRVKDDKNSADKTKPNPITIESLPDGGYSGDLDILKRGDVIYSASAVERYGYKEYAYSESDVEDKEVLLRLAVAKLKTLMAPVTTVVVRAVDQATYHAEHTHLFVGQAVRVRSKIQHVDEYMMVSSIELDLNDPSRTTATLGVAYDTLTGQQSSYLKNLNSQIVASVDAVDKLGEDIKATEITLGRVETVVDNVAADNELIVNTVGDYKWMTDTAWGKAEDAQESADEANQGVTDTNVRIDNLKLATDERIDGMETDISGINTEISNTKAEIVTIKENAEQIRQDAQAGIEEAKQQAEQIRQDAQAGIDEAKQQAEQIRQDAQAGIDEAKQQAEDIRTEANTAIGDVRTDLAATEAKAQQAASNASAALGGLSSTNANLNTLATKVDRNTEQVTNAAGEIVGVKDTISGVAETANSALTVATTNTQAINEQSTRIDTAYSDIEATRTSVSEVKQTADGLKVNLETNYLDKNALGANYASKAELSATSESITSTVSKTYATKAALESLQNIADAAIETWSGRVVPTASNAPASTWTTDALKRQHSGDIYYDMSTGKSYRWGSEDGKVYSWSMIADSDITKAIADAAKAQQTADGAKQDVVNLSNDVKATYTSKSEFKQTSDEIKTSVSEVASANETNTEKIADLSVKADGISATVREQAETISGHTTTIGQLSVKADGLQTKFEQVSDDLGHVQSSIPGLINPNFNDGNYGWIHNGGFFRISTHDASMNGPYLVGENFKENGTYELINKGLLSLTPGHKYRISILMHVNTKILRDNRLSLQFIKTYSPYVDYPNAVTYINTTDITDGRFVTYSREITCPAKVTQGYFRLSAFTNAGSYIMVKSVDIIDITEGSAALTKTSQLEQSLDGFKQTVTESYLKKGDADTKYTSKSEFAQTANEIKGTIQEQAKTISGHTTTIGQLSLKADGLQTKFEQVSDNLTELTDNLEGLINPSFSTNSMYGWTIRPTDKARVSEYDKQPGGPYLEVDAGNAAFLATIINDGISTFAPNHRYRVTLMMKVTSKSYFSNNEGLTIRLAKPNYANMTDWVDGFYANVSKSEVGTEWQSYSKDIVAGQYGATGHLRLAFQTAANTNATFAIKSVKIEDITEAQEALVKTSELQQNLDGFKQTVTESYLKKGDADTKYTSKSEFNQTANEIKGTIQEQAETISGHTTTIGQLSLKADGLQTKFEQVSNDLGHVRSSIPGLINPNFNDGNYGWIHNGASFRISTYDASLNGPYLVGENFKENGTYELINKGLLSLVPGHKYRISILMHVNTNILRDNRLSLRFIKTYSPYVDYPNAVTYINTTDITDGRFVTYSREITCPAKVTQGYFRLAAFTKAGSNSYISVKSVDIIDITEGSAALTKTSQLEQSLDGFKQTVSETYTTKTETEDAINGVQIGGTNLSVAGGYYGNSGLKNFTYTRADDQYDFDVSAAESGVWGHSMAPNNACARNRAYPWGQWGTVSFDVYSDRECTFVTDINNKLAKGGGSGNDYDLRSKAKKMLPDGSIESISGGAYEARITIPAQRWVRIAIMCYNFNSDTNPNHVDLLDNSSIAFLSLGEDFHVKVRKIKFEVGNKPTAWSPCPLDMLDKASAATEYTTKSEFTQTANEIKGTVAEQATTINGHTSTIGSLSLKADKFETDISQVTEQANAIAGRTTKLEQGLDGFKQTVNGTYITKTDAEQNLIDAINGIQIGGSNMLLDTQKFGQANPNNVANDYGRLISISAGTSTGSSHLENTKYANGFVWRGIPSSNTANNPDGPQYQVTVKPGGVYTLSFEAFTTANFWVYFHGPNGFIRVKKTICSTGTPQNRSDGAVQFNATGAKWKHYEITWELDSTGSTNTKYVLFRREGSTGYTTFMAPKLEEGNKATEWSPSPFDTLYASTITSTYAPKTMVQQTEDRITQTVEAKYATKTQLSDEMKQSLKTSELRGRTDGNYWLKMGRLTMAQQGKDFHIDYTGGRGFNGMTDQNSQLEIHVRSSNGYGLLFGVTVNRLLNADMYQVKAFVIDATHIDLYIKSGHQYSSGTMAYYGQYSDFSGAAQIDDISTAEGTELTVREQSLSTKSYVDQTANSVAIGVVEEYKDGRHGDKLTTQSNLTALKDEITASVSKQYADLSDQIKLIGSENVVGKNFSFESNNFDGWASYEQWTIGTDGAHTGRYYAQNVIPANSTGKQLISAGSIAAEYGHTYKLEYWAKKKKPNSQCGCYHRISYKRSGVWQDPPDDFYTTMFLDENCTTNVTNGRDYIQVGDDWTKVTTYIVPPSNVTEIRVRILGKNPGSVETVFAVDDVSLTDYSVAKTINKTMAGIDIKADSIVQEVRNDYATKDLVNRSIPGLKNPNFDVQKAGDYSTIAGWTIYGPWAEARLGNAEPATSSESGTYFVGKSGTTAGQTLELINQGYIPAYPGMKVQISWWMFVDSNVFKDSNFSAGIIANNMVTRNLLSNYSIGKWKYMTTTVTVPSNVSQFRVRFGFVTTGTSGWLRLDSVSVTDVTEANAAMGKATTVEASLNGYKTTVSQTYATKDGLAAAQTQWNQTAQGFEANINSLLNASGLVNAQFASGNSYGWYTLSDNKAPINVVQVTMNNAKRYVGEASGAKIAVNSGSIHAVRTDTMRISAKCRLVNSSGQSVNGSVKIGIMDTQSRTTRFNDVPVTAAGGNFASVVTDIPINFTSTTESDVTVALQCAAGSTTLQFTDVSIMNAVVASSMTFENDGLTIGKKNPATLDFIDARAQITTSGQFKTIKGTGANTKELFVANPFDVTTTGSVPLVIEGVDLTTTGYFSVHGVPANPASNVLRTRGGGTAYSDGTLQWNTDALKLGETNGGGYVSIIHPSGKQCRDDFYKKYAELGIGVSAQGVLNAVCATQVAEPTINANGTLNGIDVSQESLSRCVMTLAPALYCIQVQVNVNKQSLGGGARNIDVRPMFKYPGSNTWVFRDEAPAFRAAENTDALGWLTKPAPCWFVNLDAGTRITIKYSHVDYNGPVSYGGLNALTITRMPFSGIRKNTIKLT